MSGVLREVTISVGVFLLCSFSFEMTSLELFISQRIFTNMNCFFPRFTSLQRSCYWASLIFTACWLPQELQHTTKRFPWGSRGMSHKLTCSPFEFFFLSPVLMYTAYENLREKKKLTMLAKKYYMSVCLLLERPWPMPRVQVHNIPTGITNPTTQKSECCINSEEKLKTNNNTGHIIATYLYTWIKALTHKVLLKSDKKKYKHSEKLATGVNSSWKQNPNNQ